jgi:AraC-like DNA-binding protein/quercetin dioxygenase-like cupin family protein
LKVLPFKIPKPLHDALIYQVDFEDAFYDKLHQHEEIQMSWIAEGKGTLIVGDTVNNYKRDDIIVLGSNLPHVFKSDVSVGKKSHMVSLFFHKNGFGRDFFELEELREVLPFFKKSLHGFKVSSSKRKIISLFQNLENAKKIRRFIILLELLKLISRSNYSYLSSYINEKGFTDTEGKRMQDVFEYTMDHFKSEITLDTIAEVANMTKNAFCKYFKKRTNKTYSRFLNELRIEHACNILISKKECNIADIAELSGYKNLSNFNRQFQKHKQQKPTQYRINNV